MERPDNLKNYPARDLKLGIKSSLPKPKATIGLFILIWEIMDKPYFITYAYENDEKLNLKKEIFEKIESLLNSKNIDKNRLQNCIAENNLLTSQLEALIVAFELVWPLGKIEFENGMTNTAERTGGLRYSKKIYFTINMDFIDFAFQNEESLFYDVLLNWIGLSEIRIETKIESRLIKLLTLISEKAVYKLQADNTDVIFNNLSIYLKTLKNLSLDIKGDVEAKGSLRILLSELRENLNSYLVYDGNKVIANSKTKNELAPYAKRVDTYLLLTNEKNVVVSNNKDYSHDIPLPHNRIIFGAPGTGKSHLLEKDRKQYFDDAHYERVTFHPSYTYSQFVGAYKPVALKNTESKDDITYSFVPGPFCRTLAKAIQNPSENFLLVIEEINRANVAAVFGDVFQLLDRDESGKSEYPIDAGEDLKKHLEEQGISLSDGKIAIPANMYIWATMNSADQGVMPLDAAFKRRWEFEYIGIDENESEVASCEIPNVRNSDGNPATFTFIKWNNFRKALNKQLKNLQGTIVNEDKLLGPFFISAHCLENAQERPEDFVRLFKSKVLMYLYEDVCKMNPRALFKGVADSGKLHYSDVCAAFDKMGVAIFDANFMGQTNEQKEN